ncbi:MAG: (4Fe-4S)-binding protein, partial [Thermoleophilia bacterium]|nr:(4Fe-4S)-binding protein [Thermoleophilia bacterium]
GRPSARELHIIILDNGRSHAAADPELRETLYCLRCGACLNACAPYNMVGGHVFGGDPYPGGIGCAWAYVTQGPAAAAEFNGLCTTCARCTEVCPVRIDIPWLNTLLRERLHKEFGPGLRQRVFARVDLMGKVFSPVGPLVNVAMRAPVARLSFRALGIDPRRKLPPYERETFVRWWKRRGGAKLSGHELVLNAAASPAEPANRAALFVDCFVNHNLPSVGQAAVAVLEAAGIEVAVTQNACCGRPAMSQGLLDAPRRWAAKNLDSLGRLIAEGYEIVCIEPSCLSALRDDYRRLLEFTPLANDARLQALEKHSYDVTEYLALLAESGRLRLPLGGLPADLAGSPLVVHAHCHQKALGIGSAPARLLRLIPGVEVVEVEALCCGLVGSFGYKAEYSALSRAIGAELFAQLNTQPGTIVTCGISCRSQIEMGTGRKVFHPVEILARALSCAEEHGALSHAQQRES